MNANDIAHVTIEPHVSRFCLILADIFGKGYSNSKAGINIGNETPDENYLRNNYGAALAEAGLAVYAFKDPMSAILGRLITLRSAILNGRPTDAGCDLRDTLNSGYAIDVKCRRYREDSTSTDTTLNLILRKHELRSESHVFVLASLPFPQDNSEYMSVRSWDVNLLGWCYQHELLENTGELPYGDYYCPFRFLRPMSELDVQAQLVGIENEQQLSGE